MHLSPLEMKILGLIEPSLAAMGYGVVRVRVREGSRGTLEILAERADASGMGIDDCVEVSHTVSALLEVNDPINGPYDLEVSSPGLDRPLVSLADFKRFAGHEAKVELMLPLNGTKRFRGTIEEVAGQEVKLKVDGATLSLPFSNMRSAKLAVADAQAKAALKNKKKKAG